MLDTSLQCASFQVYLYQINIVYNFDMMLELSELAAVSKLYSLIIFSAAISPTTYAMPLLVLRFYFLMTKNMLRNPQGFLMKLSDKAELSNGKRQKPWSYSRRHLSGKTKLTECLGVSVGHERADAKVDHPNTLQSKDSEIRVDTCCRAFQPHTGGAGHMPGASQVLLYVVLIKASVMRT